MLQEDPTEAVHSELIVSTIANYFTVLEKHDTGGGLAYLLLTHNQNIFNYIKDKKIQKIIRSMLTHDHRLSVQEKIPQLFSYIIARKNDELLKDTQSYQTYQNEENRRELFASYFFHVYRRRDIVGVLFYQLKNIIKRMLHEQKS
jgi:hypothetical protein